MEFKLTDSNLKTLMVIPIALFILALFFIVSSYMQTGQLMSRGIDLEGGVQISVRYDHQIDANSFESFLEQKFSQSDIEIITTTNPATRKPEAVVVSVSGDLTHEVVVAAMAEFLDLDLEPTQYSVTTVGPALAGSFWGQAKWAFIYSFIFMMAVVGFTYKAVAPSVAIIVSTFYDFTLIIGAMVALDFRLSLASFAALLMIIGFGVNTNILITDKIYRQKEGDVFDRINAALKTGLTMSAATIATLLALFIFTNSVVLKQIAGILVIGALSDIPNTWILNVNLLLRWPKK